MQNTECSPELDAFLARDPVAVKELTLTARALILQTLPGCLEQIDPPSKIIAYGYGTRYADLVAALAPFSTHVNLMFARGASLPDPHGLLEGNGKKARHVKLTVIDDLENLGVKRLLEEALNQKCMIRSAVLLTSKSKIIMNTAWFQAKLDGQRNA